MVVGKGGFVTEASALVLSFVGVTTRVEGLLRAGWLLGGLGALGLIASNEWVEPRDAERDESSPPQVERPRGL